ncbi:MAG: GNAT family N-acetyltransferase [Proteobacteria bacterium]|nr:MAG: GNAT family N-acetyltransferase [Pseudomonadota bacterium]
MFQESNLAYASPSYALPKAFFDWKPKILFEIKQGRYLIKTAETREEFLATIQLRTDVFLKEFAAKEIDELDIDDIDKEADFLIVKDTLSGEVLASYRLICSKFSQTFYSQSEFSLKNFLSSPGHKLELSRACIRADKRTSGIFLHLLWKGLTKYIQMSEASHLFGCSSVQTLRLPEIVSVYHALRQMDALSQDFAVKPLAGFRMVDIKGLLKLSPALIESETEVDLPPLLMGYIKAGAKVHGEPAYDHDFKCLDLFTILDCDKEPTPFMKRYLEG